jgi:LPXTG-site transpeptidase (sortase) family protein
MRRILSAAGTLCVAAGLGGSVLLALAPPDGPRSAATPGAEIASAISAPGGAEIAEPPGEPTMTPGEAAPTPVSSTPATPPPAPTRRITAAARPDAHVPAAPRPRLAVTHVAIRRIPLAADVVPARFVASDGGGTWEVPAFRAGHAQYTAGAGERGNAVLFGHLSSRDAGNVFRDLDRARAGDVVEIFSGAARFEYRAVDVRAVPRTELSIVQPTEVASVTLITCAGAWLPRERDYAERLVVRAELLSAPAHGGEDAGP